MTKPNRRTNRGIDTWASRRQVIGGLGAGAMALASPFTGTTGATSNRGSRVIMLTGTPDRPVPEQARDTAREAVHEDSVQAGGE